MCVEHNERTLSPGWLILCPYLDSNEDHHLWVPMAAKLGDASFQRYKSRGPDCCPSESGFKTVPAYDKKRYVTSAGMAQIVATRLAFRQR